MSEQPQKSSELASASFDEFITDRTSEVKVRVFLCGKALDPEATIESQVENDLRAYLLTRLETEVCCHVFLGEHNQLIKTYHRAIGYSLPRGNNYSAANLALFEANLAAYVDLIVVLPDSPGSFAELGMFSVAPEICTKLLLIIKSKYQDVQSFINRGPVIAARGNRAQIAYADYDDRDDIYRIVSDEVFKIRESLATQKLWTRPRPK